MAVSLIGEAAVRLRPETSGFSQQAEVGILGPLGEVAKKGAELFGIAWGAEKTFDYLKDSVKAYSDTTESTTRAQTVFGSSFEEVQKFAEGAATAMGQSSSQALGSASTFGNLFRSMGVGTDESAKMSTSLVSLAGDMASFNNVPVDQALSALQGGLTGQTRALKQFGVNITEAQIQQEAATLGLTKHGQALDAGAKSQAVYALIMKQTSLTQGDFTRTGGNLANQQRILAAESENLKDKVGSAIYPFVDLAARGITGGLMPVLLKLATPLEGVGESAAKLGEHLSELSKATKDAFNGQEADAATWEGRMGQHLGDFATSSQGAWQVFKDNAKGGSDYLLQDEPTFVGFLSRIGSGIHGMADNAGSAWMSIRTSASSALAPMASELAPTWLSIKASLGSIFDTGGISASGAGFFGFLNGLIGKITPLITGVIDKVAPMLATILPTIGNAFAAIVPVISSVFSQIIPVVSQLLPVIIQISGITTTLFRTALMALLPVLPPIVTTIGQLVTTLVGGLAPIITSLAPLIRQLIDNGVGEFKAILQALVPVIPPLVSALGQVAQMLAGALLSVLQALMPIFPVIVTALTQIAQAVGQALISAITALAPVLPPLIQAFMSLVQAALTPLLPLLPVIASLIPPLVGVIVALVQAVAPFLPLIVQVVATLINLAVLAIQPLMPIVSLLANLLVVLVTALVPIISTGMEVMSIFLRIGAAIIGSIVSAIGAVIGWFDRLVAAASSIAGAVGRFLSGMFDGLGHAAESAFNAVTGAIKWAINGIIGIINGAIHFINRDLIGTINKIPGVNIPGIPDIPKLHEGGVFTAGDVSGEGLALLRDQELVVTPQQRATADDLLRDLLTGALPGALGEPAAPATAGQPTVTAPIYVTQQPGESGVALAARVSDRVVFNLNNGVTTTVGAGATP